MGGRERGDGKVGGVVGRCSIDDEIRRGIVRNRVVCARTKPCRDTRVVLYCLRAWRRSLLLHNLRCILLYHTHTQTHTRLHLPSYTCARSTQNSTYPPTYAQTFEYVGIGVSGGIVVLGMVIAAWRVRALLTRSRGQLPSNVASKWPSFEAFDESTRCSAVDRRPEAAF